MTFPPHLTEPDSQNRQNILFCYCYGGRHSKSAILSHEMCIITSYNTFSIYVGSEFRFCVNTHDNRTHLSTAEYYFLKNFSELALNGRVLRALMHLFVKLSKKVGSMSVCEN